MHWCLRMHYPLWFHSGVISSFHVQVTVSSRTFLMFSPVWSECIAAHPRHQDCISQVSLMNWIVTAIYESTVRLVQRFCCTSKVRLVGQLWFKHRPCFTVQSGNLFLSKVFSPWHLISSVKLFHKVSEPCFINNRNGNLVNANKLCNSPVESFCFFGVAFIFSCYLATWSWRSFFCSFLWESKGGIMKLHTIHYLTCINREQSTFITFINLAYC